MNVSGWSTYEMQAVYDASTCSACTARGHQVRYAQVAYRPAPPAYGYVPPRAGAGRRLSAGEHLRRPGRGIPQGYLPPSTVAPAVGYPPAGTARRPGPVSRPSGYPPPSTVAPGVGYPPANTPPPPPRG